MIAAHQADRVKNDEYPELPLRVMARVQETQVEQNRDDAAIRRLRRVLLLRTAVAAVTTVGLIAVGAWRLLPINAATNYAAFAARGALNTQRGGYSQQIRVLIESIKERGQLLTMDLLRRLIVVMRKYAVLDRVGPDRMADYDRIANDVQLLANAVIHTPLGGLLGHLEEWRDGRGTRPARTSWFERTVDTLIQVLDRAPHETARMRHDFRVLVFGSFLREASSAFGAQAEWFHGLNPYGGLLGRMLARRARRDVPDGP